MNHDNPGDDCRQNVADSSATGAGKLATPCARGGCSVKETFGTVRLRPSRVGIQVLEEEDWYRKCIGTKDFQILLASFGLDGSN